ncbi:MAG: copper resistance protein CopC [Anaerolineae bacterium]|nr:copper resistance protein CopC [Anaerolineae bacterium]
MKRILTLVCAFMFVFALVSAQTAPVAFAHAEPKDCTPPIGGTVDTVPTQVVCKTGQAMDPKESSLSVFNAAGEQVDLGDSAVDLNDPDRLTISVSLDTAKITDGVYTVKYITLSSDDNEQDQGEFTFTVKLATAAETPSAPETPAAVETPTAVETEMPAATRAATETAAQTEPTATPEPAQATETPATAVVTTLPATGGQVNYVWYVLIAVAGLVILSAGALILARARR